MSATTARPKTHVAIILDKSGSMASTKAAAVSGFNEQVQQMREDSKTQDILCSLVTFNGEVYEHLWNVPADQLAEAAPEDFRPDGGTAMLDAIGYTVQKLLDTTDHNDPNTSYLIVTITDGQTNMDRRYNWSSVREISQGCEKTKRWTFTYMGCTKEYLEQLSRNTGTSVANFGQWDNNSTLGAVRGMDGQKKRMKKFFAERAVGQTAAACYASDTAGEVADFSATVSDTAIPSVISIADLPTFDAKSAVDHLPKYVKCSTSEYKGGSLFATASRVQWEDKK